MATSKNAPAKSMTDDLDEMFGTDGGADFDDLLDEVEEDDAEGWVPKEKGDGIVGTVLKVSETRSDFAKENEDPMVPTVTIETKSGDKYRIIGYGAVLKRELQDANLKVGDILAVKYFGEKLLRSGKFAGRPYKHFGIAVRRPVPTQVIGA